jgi:hypothetical protein
MNSELLNHACLSDADLLMEVGRLIRHEREATARLIAALGEVDVRRLYLGEGCSSLFTYCTQVLHMSEHAAYGRIEAARAARKWPVVLELLADGSLHLTAVMLLSRHLTAENHDALFAAARHKSKRELEEIVAALRPQLAVPATVRKLPTSKMLEPAVAPDASAVDIPAANPTAVVESSERLLVAPPRPAVIKPLAPERYKLQLTLSRETHDKLREAQDLLRHRIPDGDIEAILDRALTLLLAELHKTKHAAVRQPRGEQSNIAPGRHVPAAVKRTVWQRDEGRCAFVGAAGRCKERGFLEYHHVVPFADRGPTTVENLELRCRAHNGYEAHRWSGMSEGDLFAG